jgi:hypothetical protein
MLHNQGNPWPSTTTPPAQSHHPRVDSLENNDLSPRVFQLETPANVPEMHEGQPSLLHNDYGSLSPSVHATQGSSTRSEIAFAQDRRGDTDGSTSPEVPVSSVSTEGRSRVLIDRLGAPTDSILYDPSSGRLRKSCPIIAFHQFSQINQASSAGASSRERERRVEKVLRELSADTQDHLLESFWSYYDPVMQVVNREVFEDDRKTGGMSYSGFLHICILAMGYRYADTKRPDIQKLALPNKETTLHREAKYLVENEFESPGGIPSVQALLILGQLESGSGRDGVGSMYAGMLLITHTTTARSAFPDLYCTGIAFKIALDIGLDLDHSTVNLTKREHEFRDFVLRACTAFDRYVERVWSAS